ncbi:heavy metal translocating P-type ATPase metal-binding domain-containing protein [Pedobacter sp. MC2016-05]|uniref:heavy metal translocating P-type ATPase n=1 Tax=Pedobacter sp. MC2016-05 TaxID=2994474 RepID=UPI002246633D|nr:heavy metal translocating P-type ATPase metal-binding domain-containing protein [Pedobacter sp. MC2016-05]MCX2477236.1 heavy metal translocating P-type ATPase metal-binding domain-containing protein [Pedobacter sp. MC2016-05]
MMESNKKTSNLNACFHCGDKIANNSFVLDGRDFCCAGCRGVYLILSKNNLCQYYTYSNNPGQKIEKDSPLAYLAEPAIIKKIIDYQDEEKSIVTFYIPAIHCSSCIWLLEHLYKINPSFYSSRIDFLKKQVTITYKTKEVSLQLLVAILGEIGYPPLINLQDVVKNNNIRNDRLLILKIALSGFCMSNVMLFSFPEYFGLSSLEKNFHGLFGWLNLGFTIPSIFYCAREYFVSAYTGLRNKRINLDLPLAIILAVLFLRTAVEVIFNIGIGFADTLTGLVFLLLIGKWLKQRSYQFISFDRDYRSYFPLAVSTLVDGMEKPKAIDELEIGDRLLIRNAELIPADAILMKGDAWADMSFVTGESEPIQKVLGEIIYAGGRQTGQAIELEVVRPVQQSYLTNLWNKQNYSPNLKKQTFNDQIAKYFSLSVLGLATLAAGYWFLQHDTSRAWSAFTAIIIVACPCVLVLSSSFTLSSILSIFDRHGFYVKNTDSLERLANCNTIIFDKTGTLSSTEKNDVAFSQSLSPHDLKLLASLFRNSVHPLSRSILQSIETDDFYAVEDYRELTGSGISGKVSGQMVYAGNHTILPEDVKMKSGGSGVHVVVENEYKGCFNISQKWRPDVYPLVKKLKGEFSLHVLSGDSDKDLRSLKSIFPASTPMEFNKSPMQKLDYILAQQATANTIIMIGDGLNDAGALKQSDFGIALTENINNFTPGSDAILKADALKLLPNFIQLAKNGLLLIKICFGIAIMYNCIGLFFAVQGTLYPLVAAVLMPLSTITIILFTSISTRIYAHKNKLR